MTYTVFDSSAVQPRGIVASTVLDALTLARQLEREAEREPIIASETGWMLTVDELEELARS
jgi:hypothetical protein